MPKKRRQERIPRVSSGPAEVIARPVRLPEGFLDMGDGLQVNPGKLPIPGDVYDCDFAWVQRRFEGVSLFFAKAAYDAEALATRVELRYSLEAFSKHFWENTREFYEQMQRNYAAIPTGFLERDQFVPERWKAEKSHSRRVNIQVLSRTNDEACLDFFHISPRWVAFYLRDRSVRDLEAVPVMRVLMGAEELLRLLSACERLANQLAPLLGSRPHEGLGEGAKIVEAP